MPLVGSATGICGLVVYTCLLWWGYWWKWSFNKRAISIFMTIRHGYETAWGIPVLYISTYLVVHNPWWYHMSCFHLLIKRQYLNLVVNDILIVMLLEYEEDQRQRGPDLGHMEAVYSRDEEVDISGSRLYSHFLILEGRHWKSSTDNEHGSKKGSPRWMNISQWDVTLVLCRQQDGQIVKYWHSMLQF